MNRRTIISAVAVLFLMITGGGVQAAPGSTTAYLQAGIERHIEEQVRLGGGYFKLTFRNQELRLNLVRVHTEYLSKLVTDSYFACVDLVDVNGDVYDVDFFLSGSPDAMKVTETIVHKLNGRPFYAWEQKEDGAWHRIPLEEASERHLGVIRGRDEFTFLYRARLPYITGTARMWVPLASTDSFQTIEIKSLKLPGRHRQTFEKEHGNKVLFLELGPLDSGKMVEILYQVQRMEKSAYSDETLDTEKYLSPERLVPVNDDFRRIAAEVVTGKEGDLVRARALYEHVIESMRYAKHGEGWGKGDAVYACDVLSGNCTDFHSYFIALARSAGIPARFSIGAAIPSERDEGGIDGYHCWAEFFAEGKWWPVDVSEGNKHASLLPYYFGNHPANRFELSRGRDLVVDPGPVSGPINFLAYPVLEISGEPVRVAVEFSFKRTGGDF